MMSVVRAAFVACLLMAAWSARADVAVPETRRVVIVVGHNGGAPDVRPALSYADDDAARLFLQLAPTATRAWLLTTFDRETARSYPDLIDVTRAPTKADLAAVLGEAFWLLRNEKKRGAVTELVFAFAGHGDVDDGGRGFVVLADGNFFRDDLRAQILEPSPADINHVLVDACASYFFVKSRGGNANTSVPLSPALLNVLAPDAQASAAVTARTGMLVSTSSAAEVHESSALRGGVFSYLLRSALTGVADVDGNGRIEYGETAAFVANAQANISDERARLSIHVEPPLQRPHAALVNIGANKNSTFLAIDEKRSTHVRVLDARGVPYAEVHAPGGQPVLMALSGQPFFWVRQGDKEAVLVPRSAGAYALSALAFEDAPVARGSSTSMLGLFDRAFGGEFVDGFLAQAQLPAPEGGMPFFPAYVSSAAPPVKIPLRLVGAGVGAVAGVAGVGALTTVVLNQLAFNDLQAGYNKTGSIDPAQALAVEQWRNWATGLSAVAVMLGLSASGVFLWSLSFEDGEVALP